MISALNTVIEIDLSVIVTFVSVIVLVLFTNVPLNPAYIVYAMAFYTRLNGTLGYFLSKAIKFGANSLNSIKRVQNILKIPSENEHKESYATPSNRPSINVKKLTTVPLGDNKFSLKNLSLRVKEGELVVLTGPNGCGKVS